MEDRSKAVPLTEYQHELAKLLSVNRTEDSHLAGGAAIHFEPQSIRFSNDLDYFHDTEKRVSEAYKADEELLIKNEYKIQIEITLPGYIRITVLKDDNSTKIEWAHDTAWRFMPPVFKKNYGYFLHPVDLAINKLLALAGRDEPRDYLDIHEILKNTLSLGAMCWAVPGKDPGFTPLSILEFLKRKGVYRQEDFSRLKLTQPVNLIELKDKWIEALAQAEKFISSCPQNEVGGLYYSLDTKDFIKPNEEEEFLKKAKIHYGKAGGILPVFRE